jgi:hypothetical protein
MRDFQRRFFVSRAVCCRHGVCLPVCAVLTRACGCEVEWGHRHCLAVCLACIAASLALYNMASLSSYFTPRRVLHAQQKPARYPGCQAQCPWCCRQPCKLNACHVM